MKYIVWFSGGIDSTFVAWYLKKQGHEVLLVNLKNTIDKNKCCSLPEDLIQIANFLGLELRIVNVMDDFKKFVIDDFVENYLQWKTPNPCINCNEKVRFKILNQIRQQLGFDKIATGHYVNLVKIWDFFSFSVPKDTWKDQSYMLYRLVAYQDILKYLDFPLANFEKSTVKKILEENNIPVNTSKESQNVCFIPDDDYPRFIKQNFVKQIPAWKIIDVEGNYLGEHKWLIYYTVGQKKGLDLKVSTRKYIVKIDWKNNTLIVWDDKDLYQTEVCVSDNQLLFFDNVKSLGINDIYGKIRYKGKLQEIEEIKNNCVVFKESVRAVTPGQHLVLYWKWQDKFVVVGGGLIKKN